MPLAPVRFSFGNWVAGATITATTSGPFDSSGAYGKDNIKAFDRQFILARSTAATSGQMAWVADLGVARAIDYLAVTNVNFAKFKYQADNAITFNSASSGGAQYDSDWITSPLRNAFTWRLAHGFRLSATQTRRYVRVLVDVQTPLDGTSGFSIGGFYAAAAVTALADPAPRWDYDFDVTEPRQDIQTLSGRLQRVVLGDPYLQLTFRRSAAGKNLPLPAENDELWSWMTIEKLFRDWGWGLVLLRSDQPAYSWPMRRLSQVGMTVDKALTVGTLDLLETL